MPSLKIKGVPGPTSAAYIAGRSLFARGPGTREQVFQYARFGITAGAETANLNRAIENGWLVALTDNLVGLSDRAQHYYAGTEPAPKEMGSLATPRENVNAMKPLSARYRINPRGLRADAMDNSLKAMPSHHAKVSP
jgi:hypothetical protein